MFYRHCVLTFVTPSMLSINEIVKNKRVKPKRADLANRKS